MKLLVLFFVPLFFLLSQEAAAQVMKSNSVTLDLNAKETKEQNKTKDIKIYQELSPNSFIDSTDSQHYINMSQKAKTTRLPLGLTLSSVTFDFGTIESGEAVIRTTEISVFTGSSYGYSLFTSEDYPPTSSTSTIIPNTTCDSGNCTSIISDTWRLPLTYGFGYTCKSITGNACRETFMNDAYRRFAVINNNEAESEVLGSNHDSSSLFSVKLNIPATQAKEIYQNKINLILSPLY